MRKPELRLVDADTPPSHCEKGQLSLFPLHDVMRLICVPMAEIHGAAFLRHLELARAAAVLDLRPYPFFDLLGINRSLALDKIHRSTRSYQHHSLDLRSPRDQLERWRIREDVIQFMSELTSYKKAHGTAIIVLVNTTEEAEVLAQSLQSIQDRAFGESTVELAR
ncbi:MAG: hypothetical protein CTY20_00855 [Hyphomicrobium sp.]|nr:MAG: hypothetical protein CTY20_00855 [Hyphomicrobium sp.]